MPRLPAILLLLACSGASFAEVVETLEHVGYTAFPRRGQSLRQALDDATPIRDEGKIFHGHTKWDIRWSYKWWRDGDGRCRITANKTTLDLVITMPDLQGGSTGMRQRFDRFREALLRHEHGHADIARETAQQIDDDILDLPEMHTCSALEAEANRVGQARIRDSKRRQEQFDRDTEHGRKKGASLD